MPFTNIRYVGMGVAVGGPLGVGVGVKVGVGGITFRLLTASRPGTPIVKTLTVWLPGGTFRNTSARSVPSMIVSSVALPSSVMLNQPGRRTLTITVTRSPATSTFSNTHSCTGGGVSKGTGVGVGTRTGRAMGTGIGVDAGIGIDVANAVGEGAGAIVGAGAMVAVAATGELIVGMSVGSGVAVGKAI